MRANTSALAWWVRLLTVITAAVMVAVPVSVATAPIASAADAPRPGCTTYMASLLPGTWETHPGADPTRPVGMLAEVGKKLKDAFGSEITVLFPGYSASAFDKGASYAQSEADGVDVVKRTVSACPESTWVLGGYSQGADSTGDVAWQIGHGQGPIPASQVAGVGLLADPKNGGSNVVGRAPAGDHGIAGTRPGGFGALESKTYSICAAPGTTSATGDLYCNVSARTNPLLASIGSVLGSSANGQGGTPATMTTAAPTAPAAGGAGTAPTGGASGSPQALAQSLASNYSGADFAGAQSTASQLNSEVTALQGKPAPSSLGDSGSLASIGSLAQQLIATFSPVLDTQKFVATAPGAQKALATAPAGTPTATARTMLSTLNTMDVPGIVSAASSIASTLGKATGTSAASSVTSSSSATAPGTAPAQSSLGGEQVPSTPSEAPTSPVVAGDPASPASPSDPATTGSLPTESSTPLPWDTTAGAAGTGSDSASSAGSGLSGAAGTGATSGAGTLDYSSLIAPAQTLLTKVGPLTGADPAALSSASTALGVLKPDLIINQALNVVTAVAGTDYQGIIGNLAKLPQLVFTGNVRGAHDVARALNHQFEPWVKMAAAIDYKTAGQLVSLIPDTSGTTAIVSLVLGFIGNVDIIRLARDVGQIQEVAWKIVETGNLLALSELVPIGLDLASVALGVLRPGAKMSPDQLGAGASPQQVALAQQTSGQDLPGMASSLVSLAGSKGATDLVSLVGEGLDAASFYASGAHTNYAKLIVGGGKNALQWLADFFTSRLTNGLMGTTN